MTSYISHKKPFEAIFHPLCAAYSTAELHMPPIRGQRAEEAFEVLTGGHCDAAELETTQVQPTQRYA